MDMDTDEHKKNKSVKFKKNIIEMKQRKWTNNTKQEKTPRSIDERLRLIEEGLEEKERLNGIKWNGGDKEVVNLALNENEVKEFDRLVPEGFIRNSNKREGQNEKLLSRGMTIQKNMNPFLNSGNYIKHLDAEEEYLRPRSSNM